MKALLITVFHLAVGGFAAGLAAYGGAAHLKAILLAGLTSALTSVFSLWTQRPGQGQPMQNPMQSGTGSGTGLRIFLLVFSVLGLMVSTPAQAKTVKKHALAKVARVAVKPFTATVGHPARTAKQILGSALFAVETVVDGARLGLEGADKAFDAISIKGKVPVLDAIYAGVSTGAKDAAKLDVWLERQEQDLFGTHN